MLIFLTTAIQRTCSKDYLVPGTSYTIPKGLMINVPPGENCFKNPDNFDPHNFDPENNPNKFGFTGFGQGPRNCIGKINFVIFDCVSFSLMCYRNAIRLPDPEDRHCTHCQEL